MNPQFEPNLHIVFDGHTVQVRKQMLNYLSSFAGKNPNLPAHHNLRMQILADGQVQWQATNSICTIWLQHGRVSSHHDAPSGEFETGEVHFHRSVFPQILQQTRHLPDQLFHLIPDTGTSSVYPGVQLDESIEEFRRAEEYPFPVSKKQFNELENAVRNDGICMILQAGSLLEIVKKVRASKALQGDPDCIFKTGFYLERKAVRHFITIMHIQASHDMEKQEHFRLGRVQVRLCDDRMLSLSDHPWNRFETKPLYHVLDMILRFQAGHNIRFFMPGEAGKSPCLVEFDLRHDPDGCASILFDTETPLSYFRN